jgi:hypothetical protein
LAFVLTDRLPLFDRQELLNLRSNARRLLADTGPRADEAKALLPLIEEELSKRAPATVAKRAPAAASAAKPRAKKKA